MKDMATICKKCGGIIADVSIDGADLHDCKNHKKREVNWPHRPIPLKSAL